MDIEVQWYGQLGALVQPGAGAARYTFGCQGTPRKTPVKRATSVRDRMSKGKEFVQDGPILLMVY